MDHVKRTRFTTSFSIENSGLLSTKISGKKEENRNLRVLQKTLNTSKGVETVGGKEAETTTSVLRQK